MSEVIDPFVKRYKSLNKEEKQKVVFQEPEVALRMISVFEDGVMARLFIEKYFSSEDYNDAAWHLSREFDAVGRARIPRLNDPMSFQIRESLPIDWRMELEQRYQVHICGNHVPSGNFWRENSWDNIIKTYEQVHDD